MLPQVAPPLGVTRLPKLAQLAILPKGLPEESTTDMPVLATVLLPEAGLPLALEPPTASEPPSANALLLCMLLLLVQAVTLLLALVLVDTLVLLPALPVAVWALGAVVPVAHEDVLAQHMAPRAVFGLSPIKGPPAIFETPLLFIEACPVDASPTDT